MARPMFLIIVILEWLVYQPTLLSIMWKKATSCQSKVVGGNAGQIKRGGQTWAILVASTSLFILIKGWN